MISKLTHPLKICGAWTIPYMTKYSTKNTYIHGIEGDYGNADISVLKGYQCYMLRTIS